ncbi:MAG: YggS family pyridoxal phosphate-dependent enzyme [Spirochaetales bacterium]|nr:YggS family pyridoxal phosphate-dependent enzyme [Spirochaetales bacterium]
MNSIARNIETILREIEIAAKSCGRNPDEIQLMAVSKTKPLEMLLEAYNAGMRLFGENRVHEAIEKRRELPDDAAIELIGHLQSNKVKQAVGTFSCIQSVDSLKLAEKINMRAEELGIVQDILLELKTADQDEAKTGFADIDDFFSALEQIILLKNIRIRGMMTIAPFVRDEDLIRSSFRTCRDTFLKAAERYELKDFDTLSMGMSGDFAIAIEEGATLVRIGSSIFGTRF